MTTVYIDRVLVLNFMIDDLLLLCTARIAGVPLRRIRLALCALSGALYAVAVLLPGMQWLSHPLMYALIGVLLPLAAFFKEPRRWRITALFLLLSAALGGCIFALGLAAGAPAQFISRIYRAQISWPVLTGAAVLFCVTLHLLFRGGLRHEGGGIVLVTIRLGGKKKTVPALWDTGNTLTDPVSGAPVLVLEQDILLDLWPDEVRTILRQNVPPEEKMVALHRLKHGAAFCLLPFRSVGVSAGLLLACRSDQITVERCVYRKILLALSQGPLSDGGAYHALWGGERGERHEKNFDSHSPVDLPVEQTV